MSDLIVADGKVVAFHYTLRDDSGELLDESAGGPPLAYLHGASNIVPGLEREMLGKKAGDRFDVAVPPAEGYGELSPDSSMDVPRSAFPPDAELAEGMQFATRGPQGEIVPLWIKAVSGDTVKVDAQHPLAGVTLNFSVEIVLVREATGDERAHGHPHGVDGKSGHHH
ncbi:MAG: peptidylprolyl isomerase [Myxococcales bacterium]|nr:peptidylprolyl isomerase [Myxococcales bacterium]